MTSPMIPGTMLRCIQCSMKQQKTIVFGCRDGSLVEVDTEQLVIIRTLKTGFGVQAIKELKEIDAIVFSTAQSSGYIDYRACLSLVAKGGIDGEFSFEPILEQSVSTGNIYKIIQNESDPNELILACHLGVYYVDIKFRKVPLG